jgi:tRNA threonylcarbamoyladenosine biosynthesis protein TsaE
MNTSFLSTSPEQTFQLGEKIGMCLKGDEILLLSGELGAGKTLMAKGIASAMDIDPKEVVSPSFTLMNHFEGKYQLFHIDLYRLGDSMEGDIRHLPEIDDYMGEGVIIVEWAQFLDASYFQLKEIVDICFHITPEDNRQIKVNTFLDYIKLS